jgi:hypothetical protein
MRARLGAPALPPGPGVWDPERTCASFAIAAGDAGGFDYDLVIVNRITGRTSLIATAGKSEQEAAGLEAHHAAAALSSTRRRWCSAADRLIRWRPIARWLFLDAPMVSTLFDSNLRAGATGLVFRPGASCLQGQESGGSRQRQHGVGRARAGGQRRAAGRRLGQSTCRP